MVRYYSHVFVSLYDITSICHKFFVQKIAGAQHPAEELSSWIEMVILTLDLNRLESFDLIEQS